MTYRTILLHLDNENHAPELVKFAGNLASQFGAHLMGLFVIHPLQIYVGRSGGVGISSEISTLLAQEQVDRMKRLQKVFEKETRDQDYVAEWRFIDERIWPVADTLLHEASTVDLLVIGNQTGNSLMQELTHSALLGSPVPVLLVPEGYQSTSFAQNVLVAWDGKPEAARAVGGARPILQSADNVWLHHVRTSVDTDIMMESNIKDLAENMSRHGINVEVSESVADRKAIGDELSGVIADRAVDCLVMGAYGHSKIRNLFLGNTTDYALNHLNIPLLMEH